MKPICVPCQRFYRIQKTGYYFLEGMPERGARPGKQDAAKWKPYKLWAGDFWKCEGCGHTTIAGTGREPVAIQHEPDFVRQVESFGANRFQVNDC